MSVLFGQTKQDRDELFGGFGEVDRISEEKTYVRRFVVGGVRVEKFFLPVLRRDEHGQLEEGKAVFVRNSAKGSILDRFVSLDIQLRNRLGIRMENRRSPLSPSLVVACLVFRREDPEPQLVYGEYKWQVAKKLDALQQMEDPSNPGKLLHGLWWFWDALVIREREKGKSQQHGTRYDVQVSPHNRFTSKVPVDWLPGRSGVPESFDPVKNKVFTEEEMAAVKAFTEEREVEGSLRDHLRNCDLFRPHTDEEILEALTKNPLNLLAKENGIPLFPRPEAWEKALQDLGLSPAGAIAPPMEEQSAAEQPLDVGAPGESVTPPGPSASDVLQSLKKKGILKDDADAKEPPKNSAEEGEGDVLLDGEEEEGNLVW